MKLFVQMVALVLQIEEQVEAEERQMIMEVFKEVVEQAVQA
jgi:hypothetical protein